MPSKDEIQKLLEWSKSQDKNPSNPERVKTKRLAAQVERQRKKVERLSGEDRHKTSPTVLDRVFGALSVGSAATAGFTNEGILSKQRRGSDTPNAMDLVHGLGGGVSNVANALHGRKTLGWSDVLKTGGVKNKAVRAVGGFVGDVALDPLTYVGGGIVKAAKPVEVEAVKGAAYQAALKSKGAKAAYKAGKENAAKVVLQDIKDYGAKTLLKDEHLTQKAEEVGTKLVKEKKAAYIEDEIGHDWMDHPQQKFKFDTEDKIVKKAVRTTARKAGNEAKYEYAFQEATKAEQAFKEATKGRVELKVLGTPIASSELLYKGVSKVGEVIGKTETGAAINKAFRTAAHFPGKMNILRRQFESSGVAVHEEFANFLRKEFGNLTKEEKRQLQYAIDEGTVDKLQGVVGKKGADLYDAALKIESLYMDKWDYAKHELGLFPDIVEKDGTVLKQEPLDNYVYHHYKNYRKPEAKAFEKQRKKYIPVVGTENPSFIKERKIPSLAEAKEKGLHPVEDAVEALILYDAKLNATSARKQFVKAIEDEYGVVIKQGVKPAKELGLVKGKSKFLTDKKVYFPHEIAKSMNFYETLHTNPEAATAIFRKVDKIVNEIKFLQTVVNPGHHVRNMLGDVFLNFEDGVVNPLRYKQAEKVLFNRGAGGVIMVGKNRLSPEQIWYDYVHSGAKSGFYKNELQGGKNLFKEKLRGFAEHREDFTRLAHFIDAYKKEGAKATSVIELKEAAERAAARVRKYNIDYGDLTEFEQRTMKRVVPYYTWMRKNIPLQMEMLALHPNRLAVVPKGMRAIETLLGSDREETGMIIPKWIREMGAVNIRGEGEGRNSIYWTPPNPFTELANYVEGGGQGIVSNLLAQTTPVARMPVEYATGKTLFSGAPIKDTKQFVGDTIPAARLVRQVREDVSGESGKSWKTHLANWATGAGLQEVGEKQKQSELRRQQDPLQGFIRKWNEDKKKKRG